MPTLGNGKKNLSCPPPLSGYFLLLTNPGTSLDLMFPALMPPAKSDKFPNTPKGTTMHQDFIQLVARKWLLQGGGEGDKN